MPETKNVQVILRNGWSMRTPVVEVLWECPVCGGPMGDPKDHGFCEDGDWHRCDIWENPCGHVAKYDQIKIKTSKGFMTWKEILESGVDLHV